MACAKICSDYSIGIDIREKLRFREIQIVAQILLVEVAAEGIIGKIGRSQCQLRQI